MSFWAVVFVVFMIVWLLGGGFVVFREPAPNYPHFIAYSIVPWVCVAILGAIMFGGISAGPAVR